MRLLSHFIKYRFAHGSKAWFKNHINDQFVKKANEQNYRSRAAFKLQQIQQKFNVLGDKIIDLGSSPGSWSQYALRYKKRMKQQNQTNIVSVDILDMKQIQGVDFYKCDARDKSLHKMFKQKYGYFDSIISDMAPNFSGEGFQTHEQILGLNKMCVKLALELSHRNCSLVMKTTEGAHSKTFFEFLELIFEISYRFKPKASRSQSKQFFLVCKNFRDQYYFTNSKLKNDKKIFQQRSEEVLYKQEPNKQGRRIIQFINTDFDSILLTNLNKKVNKTQLKKILDEYTSTKN